MKRINPELAFVEVKNREVFPKISMYDSDINPNHTNLKDKIINPINFTSDNPEDYIDTIGHGTFVVGIAAALTNNKTGIASAGYNPAYVVPVKIFGAGEEFFTTVILKGLIYVLE